MGEHKVWLVTGVSRGIGREIAREALSRGDMVIGTSRSGEAEIDMATGQLHAAGT